MRHDDEKEKCYFRSSERVIYTNGAWYFVTREGEEGPYLSEREAQIGIKRFISQQTDLARFQQAREAKRRKVRRIDVLQAKDSPRLDEPPVLKRKADI